MTDPDIYPLKCHYSVSLLIHIVQKVYQVGDKYWLLHLILVQDVGSSFAEEEKNAFEKKHALFWWKSLE